MCPLTSRVPGMILPSPAPCFMMFRPPPHLCTASPIDWKTMFTPESMHYTSDSGSARLANLMHFQVVPGDSPHSSNFKRVSRDPRNPLLGGWSGIASLVVVDDVELQVASPSAPTRSLCFLLPPAFPPLPPAFLVF